jgi:hypothetical protein
MRTIEIDNLILVEVPKDAKILAIVSNGIEYITDNTYVAQFIDFNNRINEIIGLIETPDLKFDFDVDDRMASCSSSCSQSDYHKEGKCDRNGCYGKDRNGMFTNKIQKAIQLSGLYLVNPHGDNKPKFYESNVFNFTNIADIRLWKQAEEKTIKGNLLLIKKV